MKQFLHSDIRNNIVLACRIIVDLKLDSGPFGNVSIRIPGTNQFWINPTGITFDQLMIDDLIKVDTHGNKLHGKGDVHPGTFIHREIYSSRQDVEAIVHTHSENTVLLSLLGCEIEPFTQLGAAIFNDQGIYHGFTGPVRTTDEGKAIAEALANKSIVIAKNHGLFTVGATITAALWDMIVADAAAKIHLSAKHLGLHSAEKLSREYMHKSRVEVRDKQHVYMWQSYVNKIRNRSPELFTVREQLEYAAMPSA